MELVNKVDQAAKLGELLRLNLQFFAEGDPAPSDPPAGDPQPQDPPSGGEPPKPEGGEPKTFTQEDLNRIAAKEKKTARENLLKELGIEDFENAKDGMAKFKAWQDSQKTEQDKLNDKLTTFETQLTEKESIISDLQAENEAIKAGITDEKNLKAVITLAKTMVNEEMDIKAAIKQVVEDYPHFAGNQQEEPKPSFTAGNHSRQGQSDMDKWIEAFKS